MPLILRSSAQAPKPINVRSPPHENDVPRAISQNIPQDLSALREAWDLPINSLDSENKERFLNAVKEVRTMYPSPEKYALLHEQIMSQFIGTDTSRNVVAGTVGAYFAGCLNTNGDGCSAICAGSAPLPTGQRFCGAHVFSAEYVAANDQYNFRRTYEAPDIVTRAIIHLQLPHGHEFGGFSAIEKSALIDNNIHTVVIRTKQDASRSIAEDSFVDISSIKTRAPQGRAVTSSGSTNGWAIFGFIVIIVIICVVIWLIVRETRKNKAAAVATPARVSSSSPSASILAAMMPQPIYV